MNNRTRRATGLLLLVAAVAAGCESPFFKSDSDYAPRIAEDRVRAIDRLALDKYTAPPEAPVTGKPIGEQVPPNPLAGLEKVDIRLDQVRAWTLQNNLDLQVFLIDPTIAKETLNEEEAKFEAVFFANFNHIDTDQPTSTQLVGSQINDSFLNTGVRIPLRTGGTATVSFPFDRTETNDQFSTLNPAYTTDLKFSISQPLLRGAGRQVNSYSIRVAAIDEDISLARTKLEVIREIAAADRAYWRLAALRRVLDVRQQQYELAMTQLERARRRVAAGRDAEVEIIRSEAGVAERLEAIITAQNDVLFAQRDLKRVINVDGLGIRSPTLLTTVTDPNPVALELKGLELADLAIANRMEMLELELRLTRDESTIAFEKNQALPLFSLDYSYNINGLGASFNDSLSTLRSSNFADWQIGFNAEISIGNDAAEARVQRAILIRLQRLSTKEARRLAIEQETLNAVDAVDAGWQRILAARQSSILAGRTLQAEQRQFEIGARTSTDVLDAASRLADAQLSEIQAVTSYQIAQVDLAFATGTLLGAANVDWSPRDPRPKEPTQKQYMDQQLGISTTLPPEAHARDMNP